MAKDEEERTSKTLLSLFVNRTLKNTGRTGETKHSEKCPQLYYHTT